MTIINSTIQGGGTQGGGDVVTAYVPHGMTPAQGDKVLLNPAGGYASGDYWPGAAPFVPVRTFFSRETTQFISGSGIWDIVDGQLKQIDVIPYNHVRAQLYNQSHYTNNLIGFVPVNGKIKFILNSYGISTRHEDGTWSFKTYYDIDSSFESYKIWTFASEARFGGVVISSRYGYSGNSINGAFLKLSVDAYDSLVVERCIIGGTNLGIGCVLSESTFMGYSTLYTLTEDSYTTKSITSFHKTYYDEENGYIYGRSSPNASNYSVVRYDFNSETNTLSNRVTFSSLLSEAGRYALITSRTGNTLYCIGCNGFGGVDMNTETYVNEIVLPNGVKVTMDALSYGDQVLKMNPVNIKQQNNTFIEGCFSPGPRSSSYYIHPGFIDSSSILIGLSSNFGYSCYGSKTNGIYSVNTGNSQNFYGSGADIIFGPNNKTYYFDKGMFNAWGGSYAVGKANYKYEVNTRVIADQYVIDDFRGSAGPTFRQMDKGARTLKDLHSFDRWYASSVLLAYQDGNTLVAYNALISANGNPGLYRDRYNLDTQSAAYTKVNSVTYPEGRTVQTSDNKYAFICAADGVYAYYENEAKTALVEDTQMKAYFAEKITDFSFLAVQSLPENDIYIITKTGDYLFHIDTDTGTVTQKAAPFGDLLATQMMGGYYNAEQGIAMMNTVDYGVLVRVFNPVLQIWETNAPTVTKFGDYSLTGIVDGETKTDVLGNTVVSVKTILDKNNMPGIDYDAVSGFMCTLNGTGIEVSKGIFYENQSPKVLAQPLLKTLSAFESGDGNGSRLGDVSDFMRLFAIAGSGTTDVDIITYSNQNTDNPTLPTGYNTLRETDDLIATNPYTGEAKQVFHPWTPATAGLTQIQDYGYVSAYETIGSPTIEAGVVSGFSDDDYLTLPSYLTSTMTSFEVVVPFVTNDITVDNAGLIDTSSSPGHNFRLTVTSAGNLRFRFSTSANSTSYAVSITGSTVLSVGVKYWAKVTYSSSSGYKLWLSSDGETYTREGSSSTTTRPYYSAGITWLLGKNAAGGSVLNGTIYLDGLSVTVDNVLKWSLGYVYPGKVDVTSGYINQDNQSYWFVDTDKTLTLDNDVVGDKAYEMGLYLVKSAALAGVAPKLAGNTPTGYDATLALDTSPVYLSEDKSFITTPPHGIEVKAVLGNNLETDAAWTRPDLTSATSYGTVTDSRNSSSEAGWKALDGSNSTNYVVQSGSRAWWNWELPELIKISKITWVHRNNSETMGSSCTCQFFTDDSKQVPLTATFTDPSSSNAVVELAVDNVITNRIYFEANTPSGYGGAAEILIEAVLPATKGLITLTTGWDLSDDKQTAFYINQNTVKTFEELTDGVDKAPQMGLWLTKTTDGVTDFKLYAAAPTDFAGVKKLADVTLSDDLSMIAEVTNV